MARSSPRVRTGPPAGRRRRGAARRRRGRVFRSWATRPSCELPLRPPLRMRLHVLGGQTEVLRRVDGQPDAVVAMRMESPLARELRERRLLVVAALGQELKRI